MNERNYANRADSNGPSAHYYLNRDGSGVKAIEPAKYAAWSNGDVKSPNTSLFGYDVLKNMYLEEGYNANEAFLLEIENCGYGSAYPITKAQKETMAYLIATFSISQDIPIDRYTVWAHGDINSETRPNCPIIKTEREAFLKEIITLSEQYKKELIASPYIAQIEALKTQNAALQSQILTLTQQIIDLEDQLLDVQSDLDQVKSQLAACQLEKVQLQTSLDEANREIAILEDIAKEYDAVKVSWKFVHESLTT